MEVPPKRRYISSRLHGVMSQRPVIPTWGLQISTVVCSIIILKRIKSTGALVYMSCVCFSHVHGLSSQEHLLCIYRIIAGTVLPRKQKYLKLSNMKGFRDLSGDPRDIYNTRSSYINVNPLETEFLHNLSIYTYIKAKVCMCNSCICDLLGSVGVFFGGQGPLLGSGPTMM
jgi:hypothetical protein